MTTLKEIAKWNYNYHNNFCKEQTVFAENKIAELVKQTKVEGYTEMEIAEALEAGNKSFEIASAYILG